MKLLDTDSLTIIYFVIFFLICTLLVIGRENAKNKVILGLVLCIASLTVILSSSNFLIFLSIEAMSIITIAFILLKNYEISKNPASLNIDELNDLIYKDNPIVKSSLIYIFLHIISGGLIISSLSLLPNLSHDKILLSFALDNKESLVSWFLFIGLAINAAIFPFSFWLTNSYLTASRSSSCYLVCFASKISLILIWKFFAPNDLFLNLSYITCLYAAFFTIFKDHEDETKNISQKIFYYIIFQIGIELGFLSFNNESLEYFSISLLQNFLPVLTILIFNSMTNNNRKTIPLSFAIAIYMLLPLPGSYFYGHQIEILTESPESENFLLFTNLLNVIVLSNLCHKIFLKFNLKIDRNLHNILLIILMLLPSFKIFSIDQFFFLQKSFALFPIIVMFFLTYFLRNFKPNIMINLHDLDYLFKLPNLNSFNYGQYFNYQNIGDLLVALESKIEKHGLLLIFSTFVLTFLLLH